MKEKEIEFMIDYIWQTLISLYNRFNIKEKIRLRNVDKYIEIDQNISDIFKISIYFNELVDSIKEILNRFQFIFEEEIILNKYTIRGKIETKLLGKYLPTYIPVRQKFVNYNIPANLLVVITLLEIRSKSLEIIQKLSKLNNKLLFKPLKRNIINKFNQIIFLCNNILSDPLLKSLIRDALLSVNRVEELEREVELESIRKPKLFKAYKRLLTYRRLLKRKVVVAASMIDDLNQKLVMDISPAKIYELFGFTLFLNVISEFIKNPDKFSVNVNKDGKEIIITDEKLKISIAYNAIPDDIKSKFDKAKIYGLIDGEIKVSNIKGLPDTFMLIEREGNKKLLVIDYKYSKDLTYQINSRFKVYSYLNEYNADVAIVISPTPSLDKADDEEEYDQRGFYQTIIEHQGAMIHINSNGKVLAILYLNPDKESLIRAEIALEKILSLAFS